jgi:hypothetical protein
LRRGLADCHVRLAEEGLLPAGEPQVEGQREFIVADCPPTNQGDADEQGTSTAPLEPAYRRFEIVPNIAGARTPAPATRPLTASLRCPGSRTINSRSMRRCPPTLEPRCVFPDRQKCSRWVLAHTTVSGCSRVHQSEKPSASRQNSLKLWTTRRPFKPLRWSWRRTRPFIRTAILNGALEKRLGDAVSCLNPRN